MSKKKQAVGHKPKRLNKKLYEKEPVPPAVRIGEMAVLDQARGHAGDDHL